MVDYRKELLREARRLIRLRSVTTDSNGAIACYVGQILRKEGFKVRYQTEKIGGIPFANVIGIKGKGKNPLILMTHLDTVPAGPLHLWTKNKKNPWNPAVRGERIYGLGSADTKLDILPKIFASRNVSVDSLKRPLWIVGTFGEERGLLGARTFCQRIQRRGGVAFVSEPSELSWVYEHRGYLVLEVSIPLRDAGGADPFVCFELESIGKSAHSSVPHQGRNAIRLAFDFLEKLSVRDSSLSLFSVQGGSSPNQVPSDAKIVFGTSVTKLPLSPFVKIRRVKKMNASDEKIPWKAFLELFEAVDEGIKIWRHPMTSNVGVLKKEKGSLKMLIDFRVHPKDDNRMVLLFFERLMKKVLRRHGLRAVFRIERDGPSLSVSPRSPIVRLARRASRASGIPFRLAKKPSCTEAGYLCQRGIPALVFGPGKSAGNIHAPNEHNELGQLEKAQRVYEALIREYCVRD